MKTPDEISPYSLIQEHLRHEPWKLLVAVILLNQTSAKQARPAWEKIFELWSSPEDFLAENDYPFYWERLEPILSPLGFKNVRAKRLHGMTRDFIRQICIVRGDPVLVMPDELYGIGKYGADSFNTFVKGYLIEDVTDKELLNYVRWAKDRRHGGDDPRDPHPSRK